MKQTFQIRNRLLKVEPSGSVLNAIGILESFDSSNPTQSLAHISRRLGIPKATAFRNLAALERTGYVTRDPATNTFALGTRVLELARRFLDQNELLAVARPVLADLAAETGETAHLGVLAGADVVYLEIAESPQRVRAVVARGDRLPAHCVASGKAILAHCDAHVIASVIAAGLERLTSHTITTAEGLLEDLAAARARGYGLNLGEWLEDVVAVSAPVFSHTGQVVGAIGIAAPRSRLEPAKADTLGPRIRDHADRLSAMFGAGAKLAEAG